jgi:hypothetical protein
MSRNGRNGATDGDDLQRRTSGMSGLCGIEPGLLRNRPSGDHVQSWGVPPPCRSTPARARRAVSHTEAEPEVRGYRSGVSVGRNTPIRDGHIEAR